MSFALKPRCFVLTRLSHRQMDRLENSLVLLKAQDDVMTGII